MSEESEVLILSPDGKTSVGLFAQVGITPQVIESLAGAPEFDTVEKIRALKPEEVEAMTKVKYVGPSTAKQLYEAAQRFVAPAPPVPDAPVAPVAPAADGNPAASAPAIPSPNPQSADAEEIKVKRYFSKYPNHNIIIARPSQLHGVRELPPIERTFSGNWLDETDPVVWNAIEGLQEFGTVIKLDCVNPATPLPARHGARTVGGPVTTKSVTGEI